MNYETLAKLISDSKQIKATKVLTNNIDGISDLCINPADPSELATSSFDTKITLIDTVQKQKKFDLQQHTKGVWTIDYNPTSPSQLISGGNDNKLILWDISRQKPIKTLSEHSDVIYDVQYSTDGHYIGSVSKNKICIWDTANLSKPVDTIKPITNPGQIQNGFIYCINFLSNNKKIITGFVNGTLLIHGVGEDKSKDRHFEIPTYYDAFGKEDFDYAKAVYNIMKFKNDDNKILLSHSDGSVRIYQISGEKLVEKDKFFYFTSPVTYARIDKDDLRIIACGKDRSGQIWQANRHDYIDYTMSGHFNIVSCADFINEHLCVTGSYDNTIRFWNV